VSEKKNPLDLICYHVGGYGDYSHVNVLGMAFPKRTVYVAFEARQDDDDIGVQETYLAEGIRTILIQKCVSDRVGTEKFYINTHPDSSSIYKASPEAQREHMPDWDTDPAWFAFTQLDRTVKLKTTTIDEIVANGDAPPPDMLSIDAQGAELKILHGTKDNLENEVVAVITEVEFHEIYKGQPLFSDQFDLLYKQGFRLAEIFAQQYWHPLARAGYGLLTVGEALFLRDPKKFTEISNLSKKTQMYKLIKSAVIAFLFGRLSLAVHTLNFTVEKYGKKVIKAIESDKEYIVLLELRDYINGNMDQYNKNARFFEESKFLRSRYGPIEALGRRSLPKNPIHPYVEPPDPLAAVERLNAGLQGLKQEQESTREHLNAGLQGLKQEQEAAYKLAAMERAHLLQLLKYQSMPWWWKLGHKEKPGTT
jgi:FkbM family methyltransferase